MELPFPDGSFDCAVSLDTLEHVPAEARPRCWARCAASAATPRCSFGPVREETALAEELLFDISSGC